MRHATRTVGLAVALVALAGSATAQETRVPVRVTITDVAGSTVYVDAGSTAGLAEGMTVDARVEGGVVLGSLVVLGVTEDRAGLTFEGSPFPLTRGQTLVLEVPVAAEEPGGEPEPDTTRPARPVPAARAAGPRPGGLRVAGSLGLELEAYRATSTWAKQVDGTVTQDLLRPALRLRGDVSGLPAGVTASTDLRVWYRGSSASVYEPATSVRVYRASLDRDVGALRLRAGRFWAQEVPFAAYWDGALARVGGAAGAGVAVGFTPHGGAEGVDTDAPKLAAFLDYERRSQEAGAPPGPEAWGALSFVQQRLPWEDTTVRSVGWTQRARWGPASLNHRLEVELGADDPIAHANVDLALDLPLGTRVTAAWLRDRYRPLQLVDGALLPRRVRERASLGVAWNGRPGGIDVRAGVLGGDEEGHSLDGTVWVAPLERWMPTISVASSYWASGDRSWLFVSPALRRRVGPVDARVAYHHYRIDDVAALRIHGGDVSATFPLAGLRARLGLQGEWGDELVTLRLVSGLWLRF